MDQLKSINSNSITFGEQGLKNNNSNHNNDNNDNNDSNINNNSNNDILNNSNNSVTSSIGNNLLLNTSLNNAEDLFSSQNSNNTNYFDIPSFLNSNSINNSNGSINNSILNTSVNISLNNSNIIPNFSPTSLLQPNTPITPITPTTPLSSQIQLQQTPPNNDAIILQNNLKEQLQNEVLIMNQNNDYNNRDINNVNNTVNINQPIEKQIELIETEKENQGQGEPSNIFTEIEQIIKTKDVVSKRTRAQISLEGLDFEQLDSYFDAHVLPPLEDSNIINYSYGNNQFGFLDTAIYNEDYKLFITNLQSGVSQNINNMTEEDDEDYIPPEEEEEEEEDSTEDDHNNGEEEESGEEQNNNVANEMEALVSDFLENEAKEMSRQNGFYKMLDLQLHYDNLTALPTPTNTIVTPIIESPPIETINFQDLVIVYPDIQLIPPIPDFDPNFVYSEPTLNNGDDLENLDREEETQVNTDTLQFNSLLPTISTVSSLKPPLVPRVNAKEIKKVENEKKKKKDENKRKRNKDQDDGNSEEDKEENQEENSENNEVVHKKKRKAEGELSITPAIVQPQTQPIQQQQLQTQPIILNKDQIQEVKLQISQHYQLLIQVYLLLRVQTNPKNFRKPKKSESDGEDKQNKKKYKTKNSDQVDFDEHDEYYSKYKNVVRQMPSNLEQHGKIMESVKKMLDELYNYHQKHLENQVYRNIIFQHMESPSKVFTRSVKKALVPQIPSEMFDSESIKLYPYLNDLLEEDPEPTFKTMEIILSVFTDHFSPSILYEYVKINQTKFTPGEDLLLLMGVKRYGTFHWKQISKSYFPNKTDDQLFHRYKNLSATNSSSNQLKEYLNKNKLNKEEEEIFEMGLIKYGENSWDIISKELLPSKEPHTLKKFYEKKEKSKKKRIIKENRAKRREIRIKVREEKEQRRRLIEMELEQDYELKRQQEEKEKHELQKKGFLDLDNSNSESDNNSDGYSDSEEDDSNNGNSDKEAIEISDNENKMKIDNNSATTTEETTSVESNSPQQSINNNNNNIINQSKEKSDNLDLVNGVLIKWTKEEDRSILLTIKEKGSTDESIWKYISENKILEKTPEQIMNRYNHLLGLIKKSQALAKK
ncbi:hypothetical protein DICPUDRAFT_96894 [Dictyostelium purpureum]|uniref:Myb-like domain-containing protein n=1 Tax=Dictyostelium purpureum TaxID=5786 RepID=F0ZC39_DICPU|nr:uncharacterized protein DICPUDRAFT_96894 [Dictyostelium purpureum]EGC38507.1 hypothetical protein DICPUDRAFT_96894 [Dictyostelium purpureum]|eukprot:XP_003284972.1 hypothetical protein DICPUDRAFT_96894 [Dictyostelium purpureum]